MTSPKVVLIGAASRFFGRQTIMSMVTKPGLCSGTLALVDPDTVKLRWMENIAKRCIAERKSRLKLEVATDRKKVLKGADFVILAFAVEGVKLRGVDARISTKHGMTMCSADTVGPGGIMRTVREIPRQNRIMKDVEKLCPNAWVLNWVNPTSAMGIGMMRHFPHIKSLAICDGPHNPYFDNNLIIKAGLAESAEKITDAIRRHVHIRSGGINHFNWLIEMTYKGRDVTPRILQTLKDDKHRQLAEAVGYIPMCFGHTREYVPYFMGHDVSKKGLKIDMWSVQRRRQVMRESWADMRAIASGRRPVEDFLQKTRCDHACDIIEAMWLGLRKPFYINTRNGGSITNMTDDAYVEVPCLVDMHSCKALPFGPMPRPLLGYMQRVLDEHELAVEAAATCDRDVLRQAFMASMTAVSIPDVEACMNEMLRAERDYLPRKWFR